MRLLFLHVLVLLLFVMSAGASPLFGDLYSGKDSSQVERYYIGEVRKYIFCLNNQFERQWIKEKMGHYTRFFLSNGFMIVIDGSRYLILTVDKGDTLYSKTLKITPNGTSRRNGEITVNFMGEKETFPIFPSGFHETHSDEWTNPLCCEIGMGKSSYGPKPIIEHYRHTNVRDSLQLHRHLIHFKDFFAVFDGTTRLLWKKDITIPIKSNILTRWSDMFVYADKNRVFALDPESGRELGSILLSEEIGSMNHGKGQFFVYLQNGERVRVDEELLEFKSSK